MGPRKTLTWLAAVACLATACTATSAATGKNNTRPMPSAASEARNKALVLRLYTEAFNQNKPAVVKELLAPDYIQHDPSVRGGAAGQAEEFTKLKARMPGAVATVKHVAADGDLVAVHWQASATPANEATGEARVDLYRVGGAGLTEHWGVTQTVPATTANGNSLFDDVYRYPKTAPALTDQQEEKNRVFVVEAYRKLSDGDVNVLDQSWDPRYYQHNPAIANGTGPLKELLRQDTRGATAGTGTRFGKTLADGDLVWVFSSDYTVADIFRVPAGKIIEHWDVVADKR